MAPLVRAPDFGSGDVGSSPTFGIVLSPGSAIRNLPVCWRSRKPSAFCRGSSGVYHYMGIALRLMDNPLSCGVEQQVVNLKVGGSNPSLGILSYRILVRMWSRCSPVNAHRKPDVVGEQ